MYEFIVILAIMTVFAFFVIAFSVTVKLLLKIKTQPE